METPKNPTSIEHRIEEGLARLAAVIRADDWNRAKAAGINPTQQGVLDYLRGRPQGSGLTDIAVHLLISQPTATDSVAALERKGLVERRASETDRRAVRVLLTEAGVALLEGSSTDGKARVAVKHLDEAGKAELLLTVVRLIKTLQDIDAVPVQRMCVTCRHFAPFAHPDGEKPHHCHYVNAAFGQRELRIDCHEHDTADPASRAATWEVFQRG